MPKEKINKKNCQLQQELNDQIVVKKKTFTIN